MKVITEIKDTAALCRIEQLNNVLQSLVGGRYCTDALLAQHVDKDFYDVIKSISKAW